MEDLTKDPNDTTPVTWDFTNECNGFSAFVTVSSATLTAPTGISTASGSAGTTSYSCVVTSGTPGRVYKVACQATLSNSATVTKSKRITVKEL